MDGFFLRNRDIRKDNVVVIEDRLHRASSVHAVMLLMFELRQDLLEIRRVLLSFRLYAKGE